MPGRPTQPASSGAITSESANISAMLAPTMAMALVRTLSRVTSARNAVTAAEMAPAPCTARPMDSQVRSGAQAAMALPVANSSRPATMVGLRPKRSDAMPNGICRNAWVRPYRPMAKPTRAGSSPPGRRAASSANTGSTMNRPSMRRANTSASAALARRSSPVMRLASGAGAPLETGGAEVEDTMEKHADAIPGGVGDGRYCAPKAHPTLAVGRGPSGPPTQGARRGRGLRPAAAGPPSRPRSRSSSARRRPRRRPSRSGGNCRRTPPPCRPRWRRSARA